MDYLGALDELYQERRTAGQSYTKPGSASRTASSRRRCRRAVARAWRIDERKLVSERMRNYWASRRRAIRTTVRLPLEKPEPEVLLSRAMAVTWFEAAFLGHLDSVGVRKRHAEPSVVGRGLHRRVPLHLKLE